MHLEGHFEPPEDPAKKWHFAGGISIIKTCLKDGLIVGYYILYRETWISLQLFTFIHGSCPLKHLVPPQVRTSAILLIFRKGLKIRLCQLAWSQKGVGGYYSGAGYRSKRRPHCSLCFFVLPSPPHLLMINYYYLFIPFNVLMFLSHPEPPLDGMDSTQM